MTNPKEVYESWENYDGRTFQINPLDFDLNPGIFPMVESSSGVLEMPLTKTPTDPPTGAKMIPVRIPTGVTSSIFKGILSAAFQHYLETGNLNEAAISRLARQHISVVRNIMATEEFGYALACRGVDTQGIGTLTPQQDAALMILTDIGSRKSWGARLKDAGINQSIYMAWMKNPTFARRMQGISEAITANSSIALVELGRKVGEGDLSSIKLQLEISGRHNPAAQTQIDLILTMNRILDILTTHLASEHPDVLSKVAKDMRALAETVSRENVLVIEA